MLDKKAQGKKNRRDGANFEKAVRLDLESQGWIVSKWANQVEICPERNENLNNSQDRTEGFNSPSGRLVPAKSNRFNMRTCGFPDFICFRKSGNRFFLNENTEDLETSLVFEIIGVEAKSNGYLDKIEKEKCKWLIKNKIFSKILIASKDKEENKKISYKEFSF
jgi:hypothetical protein